jgi:hypothetical protein
MLKSLAAVQQLASEHVLDALSGRPSGGCVVSGNWVR